MDIELLGHGHNWIPGAGHDGKGIPCLHTRSRSPGSAGLLDARPADRATAGPPRHPTDLPAAVRLLINLSCCQKRRQLARDFELVARPEAVGTDEHIAFEDINVDRRVTFHERSLDSQRLP